MFNRVDASHDSVVCSCQAMGVYADFDKATIASSSAGEKVLTSTHGIGVPPLGVPTTLIQVAPFSTMKRTALTTSDIPFALPVF